jgi:hypothetical protein
MKVQIVNDADVVIWERGDERGLACRGYVSDGTQERIIDALRNALEQAQAELSLFDNTDRVLDSGATAA